MALGIGARPVLAAEKVVDIKERGTEFTFFDPVAGVCGAIALTVFVTVHQFTFTLWDNGHAKYMFAAELNGFSADGIHRSRDHATENDNIGPTGLPLTVHFTSTGVCTPASGVPGLQWHTTFGFTINENGDLVSLRIIEIGDPPGP